MRGMRGGTHIEFSSRAGPPGREHRGFTRRRGASDKKWGYSRCPYVEEQAAVRREKALRAIALMDDIATRLKFEGGITWTREDLYDRHKDGDFKD